MTNSIEPISETRTTSPHSTWRTFFILLTKATSLSIAIAIVMLLLTAIITGLFFWNKANAITKDAGLSMNSVIDSIKIGLDREPMTTDGKKHILILGLDSLTNRPGSPPLADTVMIATINVQTGHITLTSLPRDLWIDAYQTKINALYVYGIERNELSPLLFPTTVISELTGLPIHHAMTLTMDDVSDVIDAIGGVTIAIPTTFTDDAFPRTDVDVTKETDPKILYKSITFAEGQEHMSGERALEYMRSRHSADDSGTDLARSERQQLVIRSLFSQLLSKQVLFNSTAVSSLLSIYRSSYQHIFPIDELIATAKALYPNRTNIVIDTYNPSIYPENDDGVLMHPPIKNKNAYNGQWVYIVRDPEALKNELQKAIE